MSLLSGARVVVFDFDGTLVDSNEIKWKGFEYTFSEYPAEMAEISAYCRGSNHTIRGEKFRHVTEKILGLSYTQELSDTFHRRYADYTTDAVVAAPEIPGASVFVRQVSGLQPSLLSSTPHEILLKILDRRGWGAMFTRIQGAPVSKRVWLRDLQRTLECDPQSIVFFGDTSEDEESARASSCRFVRVGPGGIPDFRDLLT